MDVRTTDSLMLAGFAPSRTVRAFLVLLTLSLGLLPLAPLLVTIADGGIAAEKELWGAIVGGGFGGAFALFWLSFRSAVVWTGHRIEVYRGILGMGKRVAYASESIDHIRLERRFAGWLRFSRIRYAVALCGSAETEGEVRICLGWFFRKSQAVAKAEQMGQLLGVRIEYVDWATFAAARNQMGQLLRLPVRMHLAIMRIGWSPLRRLLEAFRNRR